jgi:F-type H+-transporting ATPase subunit delta
VASQDQGPSGLAGRYAIALYELAEQDGSLDRIAEDLQSLKGMIAESEDLRRLVRSPVIGWEEQHRALDAILDKAGAQDLTRKFVGMVAQSRRLFALADMCEAFLAERARRRGEVTARVTTATALSDAQSKALGDQLKKALGSTVTIDATVDPSLLGGMIVQVGSRMVDTSLRTKLNKLQLAMKGVA